MSSAISSCSASLRAAVLLLAPLVVAACGGGAAPAAPSGGAPDAAPPETFAEVKAEDIAALGAAGAALDAGAPAPSTSGSSKPPADVAAADPPNECAPVAVDYEQRARPKLKACYADGKKKEPDLKGTVKLVVDIGVNGKISSTKIADKTLPDPVAQCMLKALKATPLPEASKCPGKSLTIPITFPTPK